MYDANNALEATHWWFVARQAIVLNLLRRERFPARPRILDIGCGTGQMLDALQAIGPARGIDMAHAAIAYARAKTGADVRYGALPDAVPFADASFDVITMCDVLEHIEDDRAALRRVHALLVSGGRYLCTVPAYAWLWSSHDVLMHHFRRYTRSLLATRLREAGFRVRKISYYNSFLFPPIALVRLWRNLRGRTGAADLGPVSPASNALLRAIFASERFLLPYVNFPVGVSLIAIAERP